MNKVWVKVEKVDLVELLVLLSNTAKVVDVQVEFNKKHSAIVWFNFYEDEEIEIKENEDYPMTDADGKEK